MSIPNLHHQHSPIDFLNINIFIKQQRTKFEYNNFGELIQKQGSPRVLHVEPAPDPTYFLQNGSNQKIFHQQIDNGSKYSQLQKYQEGERNQYEQIKKRRVMSDKPNQIAFDPRNYQAQLQQLYGQSNPRYANATSVANPFQRASFDIINTKNDKYIKEQSFPQTMSKSSLINEGYQYTKNISMFKDDPQTLKNNSLFARNEGLTNQSAVFTSRKEYPNDTQSSNTLGEMYASQAALKKDPRQVDLTNQRNDQHLYVSDLYKNLRKEYTNLNLRSHLDKVIKPNDQLDIGDKKRFFSKVGSPEPILANENQLKNSMERFYSPEKQYQLQKSENQKRVDPIFVLEKGNRQYALSVNDSVNSMMNLSKKLRQMKDIIRTTQDHTNMQHLSTAVQRRIISNNKREERKSKLAALLGKEIYTQIQPKYTYLLNKNS